MNKTPENTEQVCLNSIVTTCDENGHETKKETCATEPPPISKLYVRRPIRIETSPPETKNDLEEKNKVLSAAIHDMRNQLTVIIGNLSIIGGYTDANTTYPPDFAEIIADMNRAAEVARIISGNALAYNKNSDSKKQKITPEPLNPEEFIRRITGMLAPGIVIRNKKRITCINADPIQFERLILNLINNAMKYSDTQTPPEIIIEETSDEIRVSVMDRGNGITKNVEQLFGYHHRGDNTDNVPGFGIGLMSCKMICDAHGWNISAKNNTHGKGCSFTVHIPKESILIAL